MRILATGADGFIGRAVIPALQARDAEIDSIAHRDIEAAPLQGYDAIVHLAGLAHSKASEAQLMAANCDLTLTLAQRARDAGVRKFVFASSVKAVGDRTYGTRIDDFTKPAPQTAYGRSKLGAEQGLAQLGRLDWIALRMPLVHGPDAKANFAALLKLVDTPLPLPFADLFNNRSLLSLESAGDAFAAAVFTDAESGAYCVADPPPLSTARMVSALRSGMNRPKRLVKPGVFSPLLGMKQFRMLTESLEIDDTRFRRTYGIPGRDSNAALKETGRRYAESKLAR